MKICYIFRPVSRMGYSIENVFHAVAEEMNSLSHVTILYNCSGSWIKDIINIRKIDADIYHISGDVYFLSLLLPRNKTTATFHDIGSVKNFKPSLRVFMIALLFFILPSHKMKKMTCVSSLTKDDMVNYFRVNPQKITVIENPLSLKIKYIPKEFNAVKPVILQIGTGGHKNLTGLIEAVKDIPCHLKIIGKPSEDHIKKMELYGIEYSVESLLTNNQVIDRYCKCDILFFASFSEGFGLPIVEAQAIGRPVITSNIAPMPNVAGKGAAFVNPASSQDIRKALISIITDSENRQTLIREGLSNIERYNLTEVTRKYIGFYESFILA